MTIMQHLHTYNVHMSSFNLKEKNYFLHFYQYSPYQNSCALHLQVALSYFLCKLAYKTLEGGFPDEEICCFLELMDLP